MPGGNTRSVVSLNGSRKTRKFRRTPRDTICRQESGGRTNAQMPMFSTASSHDEAGCLTNPRSDCRMRRSSADLPVRHTNSLHFFCTKTARGHLLLASGFLRSPAILVNVIFVALRGHGDFPRACNDHGKLNRGIFSGMGTLQLLNQLVQPLHNKAASNANDHAEHEDGHENHNGENVPSRL